MLKPTRKHPDLYRHACEHRIMGTPVRSTNPSHFIEVTEDKAPIVFTVPKGKRYTLDAPRRDD